jgi:hypothetical protein
MQFLGRYKNGERDEVWNELSQRGEDIGEPGVADDALGVAREAMQRARRNIEVLQERWTKEGWQFGYDWASSHVADEVTRAPPRLIPLEPGRVDRWRRVSAKSELPIVLGAVAIEIGPRGYMSRGRPAHRRAAPP